MKRYWKWLALCVAGLAVAVAIAKLPSFLYPKPDISAALATEFDEQCLTPETAQRPVWECYELVVDAPAHQPVTIEHEGGERHQVLTFEAKGDTRFRFTPTQKGRWTFSTGGELVINGDRPDYAKGFVAAAGNQWVRTGTEEAFVPQYMMYDKPDLAAGLSEFVDGHGFTGFHITNLRDFLENPDYFEAVVLKTYRHGGATHFWIWGDRSRKQTPTTYGVDPEKLYTEIAARLAPLPGWSVGYGFDLFEWASAEEIEQFREFLRSQSSYHHMVGARGHKNQYREISPNLDYASWEWHRPKYQDYRDHLENARQRPAFSEDRFRYRVPTKYPGKDYDPELTRLGLWDSLMAGGVANIWGYQPAGEEFSAPYPNKAAIQTYHRFASRLFKVGMEPDNTLVSNGYCLRQESRAAICYSPQLSEPLKFQLDQLSGPLMMFAVDTQKAYQEIEIPVSSASFDWQPPYASDWAFGIQSPAPTAG